MDQKEIKLMLRLTNVEKVSANYLSELYLKFFKISRIYIFLIFLSFLDILINIIHVIVADCSEK